MSYQDNRELARIRGELRTRLMARRYDGTSEILLRLRKAAERQAEGGGDLRNEYARWKMRFEMLGG